MIGFRAGSRGGDLASAGDDDGSTPAAWWCSRWEIHTVESPWVDGMAHEPGWSGLVPGLYSLVVEMCILVVERCSQLGGRGDGKPPRHPLQRPYRRRERRSAETL